ncbi:hypothetical protein [Thermoanaerobacter sp. A7A]|uniref:hypothetical protein n=1 Tax=Thermoanaerobacter sp. A7A TaxID=1350366 RepID=UPI0004A4FC69|nr:hypothetical protein [Thermoanaerobacter sp. A7A]
MFTEKQIEDKTVELLAVVYNSINWSKMHTSKNPHDIFNHRVRAASRRATLFEAVSKLANYFGLQSLPAEAIQLTQELRPYERTVLNKMYMEHIPISMMAIMRAKERRKNKSQMTIFENIKEEELKDE